MINKDISYEPITVALLDLGNLNPCLWYLNALRQKYNDKKDIIADLYSGACFDYFYICNSKPMIDCLILCISTNKYKQLKTYLLFCASRSGTKSQDMGFYENLKQLHCCFKTSYFFFVLNIYIDTICGKWSESTRFSKKVIVFSVVQQRLLSANH